MSGFAYWRCLLLQTELPVSWACPMGEDLLNADTCFQGLRVARGQHGLKCTTPFEGVQMIVTNLVKRPGYPQTGLFLQVRFHDSNSDRRALMALGSVFSQLPLFWLNRTMTHPVGNPLNRGRKARSWQAHN